MRTEIRENVRVTAANVTSLNFTLEIGAAQESVSVTAETLLQADTSTTGASLDTKAYADLPLTSGGSRRPNRFMLLVPGTSGNPTGFTDSIAGGQASTKEIQLEGASMATQEIHGDGRNVTFPPDAVEEVSVARDAQHFRFEWRCSTLSTVWNLGTRRAISATRKHSEESQARPIRLETCRLR